MAELYDDWLARPMSRVEYNELSDEERKERNLAQKRIYVENNSEKVKERARKYREEHPEKYKASKRKYEENNSEKNKANKRNYQQSPAGKKQSTLSNWRARGLQETPEEMDRLYELRQTQELCSSCDVKLTRTGKYDSTYVTMDHSHLTNRFRQICCKNCNHFDSWKKYWVDGIFGGLRPRPSITEQTSCYVIY
jgi:hypothetical protein